MVVIDSGVPPCLQRLSPVERIIREVAKQTWHRVAVSLTVRPEAWNRGENPYAVMQDVVDSVYQLFEAPPNLRVVFHFPGKDVHFRIEKEGAVDVEFLFFRCTTCHVEQWIASLSAG